MWGDTTMEEQSQTNVTEVPEVAVQAAPEEQNQEHKASKPSKRKLFILIGSLAAAALIICGVLVLFRKNSVPKWVKNGGMPEYDIPEVPEGYKLQFSLAAVYNVSAKGKVTLSESYEYDAKGNCTKVIYYDEKGKKDGYTVYQYDDRNNRISNKGYDAKNKLTSRTTMSYDANGRCTEMIYEDLDASVIDFSKKTLYEYDKDGNRIRETEYYLDGRLDEDRQYDASGKLLTKNMQDIIVHYYAYNEDGNLLSEKVSYKDERFGEYYAQKNHYSEDGLLLEEIESPESEIEKKTVYEYDETGKIQKTSKWEKGRLTQEVIYVNGFKTEIYNISEDGTRTLYSKMKNDEYGNQTMLQTYDEDGKIKFWAEMEYEGLGLKYGKYTKITGKDADGNVTTVMDKEYYESNGHLAGLLSEFVYNPDGTFHDRGEGYNGFILKMDDYGNIVRYIKYRNGKTAEQEVSEYRVFVVPNKRE